VSIAGGGVEYSNGECSSRSVWRSGGHTVYLKHLELHISWRVEGIASQSAVTSQSLQKEEEDASPQEYEPLGRPIYQGCSVS